MGKIAYSEKAECSYLIVNIKHPSMTLTLTGVLMSCMPRASDATVSTLLGGYAVRFYGSY